MDDIRCLWGRGFVASAGSETTPLTAVAYDKDQPEVVLSVPAGTGIWVYRAEAVSYTHLTLPTILRV